MAGEQQIKEAKEAAKRIVLTQGNKYIKELLRSNKAKIGKNKEEFLKNLLEAIDDGKLNKAKIDEWLGKTEGWGNQHIYLFKTPQIEPNTIPDLIKASETPDILDKSVNYEFPDELTLKVATLDTTEDLSLEWREGNDSWVRAKAKDYRNEIDGEEYEFRAYREKSERRVVRFRWVFKKMYCAVYISHANEKGVHEEILNQVWEDMAALGVVKGPLTKISLSNAFRKMNDKPELKVNSVRMAVDGGHVNLVATAPQSGIHDVQAIRQAKLGIDAKQFTTSDGMFHFNPKNTAKLENNLKVEGSGADSRIRIWAQCVKSDVDRIVEKIHGWS